MRALTIITRLLLGIFGFVAVILGVAYLAAPKHEWKLRTSETFVIGQGAGMVGYETNGGKPVRVVVSAKSPVSIGFFPARWRGNSNALSNAASVRANFYQAACGRRSMLATTVECVLPEKETLAILDERNEATALTAGVGIALGVRGLAEQAAMRNDVTLQIYDYVCVRNCPVDETLPAAQ